MSAIVVNLFGAPGAGKSTGAAYIFFSILKMNGINAELVTEFAKKTKYGKKQRLCSEIRIIYLVSSHLDYQGAPIR